MLTLGSSSLIANIIAGYTMTYRRAFKEGDRVKFGEYVGEVTEVRLLETHLKSLFSISALLFYLAFTVAWPVRPRWLSFPVVDRDKVNLITGMLKPCSADY